jgi:hypothetical protein
MPHPVFRVRAAAGRKKKAGASAGFLERLAWLLLRADGLGQKVARAYAKRHDFLRAFEDRENA